MIELPARSSETHTKETLNSSWHLFRSCSWKAADREASSPESVRMLSDIQRVSFSYRRCKEPAEINVQIVSPAHPLPVGIIYILASHVTEPLCHCSQSSDGLDSQSPCNIYSSPFFNIELLISATEDVLPSPLFHLIFMSTPSTSFSGHSLLRETYRYHSQKSISQLFR